MLTDVTDESQQEQNDGGDRSIIINESLIMLWDEPSVESLVNLYLFGFLKSVKSEFSIIFSDLEGLRQTRMRNAYSSEISQDYCYLKSDVEKR